MIIDCPSGTGKTLAGVALSLLDYRQKSEISKGNSVAPVAVVHLIWPEAVGAQPIYEDIVEQTGVNDLFFQQAAVFDFVALKGISNSQKEQYVRNNLLKGLIPGLDTKQGQKRSLLVIIDEVPEDPVGMKHIGEIRDALKLVNNLCLVLSGTHSKASNMIGLSQGAASSKFNAAPSLWAMIVTRLPRFLLYSSFVANQWDEMNQSEFTKLSQILGAIQCSISNGGNPRLIVFAIQAAYEVFLKHKNGISSETTASMLFYAWQNVFSGKVIRSKFSTTSLTRSYKGLVGQLNLLLEASATADLSDVLVGHHFAFRAIPDNAATTSSNTNADFRDCGGCLYLAQPEYRAVGQSMFFVPGKPLRDIEDAERTLAIYSWQTTRFSPAHVDILLYLMACRSQGYFLVAMAVPAISFCAHQLLLSTWSSKAAGLVNFQNPRAVINSGSFLEVLMSIAISNAAGRASGTHGFDSFMREFGKELGLIEIIQTKKIARDKILSKLSIPKFIFPGQNQLLSNDRHLGRLNGLLGTAERQANVEGFDLLVQAIGSSSADSIRFEAKDRDEFRTGDLIDAARKLMRGDSNVGVLVLRECNLYWGKEEVNINNRETLQKSLKSIPKLGKAYLISSSGVVVVLSIHRRAEATGRLILLQVPESSLRETLKTIGS